MIRFIDQATCDRWDRLLAELDPTEHAGGAHNPYEPGWYWFDSNLGGGFDRHTGTPRGPFATYIAALIDQSREMG